MQSRMQIYLICYSNITKITLTVCVRIWGRDPEERTRCIYRTKIECTGWKDRRVGEVQEKGKKEAGVSIAGAASVYV